MRRAYVAAPFRREAREIAGRFYGEMDNEVYMSALRSIEGVLVDRGFDVCLPHRDEGEWGRLYYDPGLVTRRCFDRIRGSDLVVALPGVSRGVHVELGYAAALGKRMIVLIEDGERESTLLPGVLEVTPAVRWLYRSLDEVPAILAQVLDEFDGVPAAALGQRAAKHAERVGLIDIGSNTTKLIVAETHAGQCHVVERVARSESRLAEGLYPERVLQPEAIVRTAVIVKELCEYARSAGAVRVRAVSTGAAREARNSNDLLEQCKSKANLDVEILTANREAELLHRGVLHDFDSDLDTFVVLNIGGVSTELTVGTKSAASHKVSLELGALRLSERFIHSDHVDDTSHAALTGAVRATLLAQGLPRAAAPYVLVHTGGELDYLLTTGCPLWPSSYSPSHPVQTSPLTFRAFAERMRTLSRSQLHAFMPANPRWMDGAIASNAITVGICDDLGIRTIVPSNKNLTDGLLLELAAGLLDSGMGASGWPEKSRTGVA